MTKPKSTITAITQGNELEAVLDDGKGNLYPLQDSHFRLIAKLSGTKVNKSTFHTSHVNGHKYIVGVKYDVGEQSLDAARSLPEMNFNPVGLNGSKHGLNELSRNQLRSLTLLNQAVRRISHNTQAGTISLSMHPLAKRDQQTYKKVVTPKALYHLLWEWGWDHSSGIIAAHTSPWTSIDIDSAADAVSVIIGMSPALIAIFGNSPIVEGQLTGVKENRQTMWKRMVSGSKRRGDKRIFSMPPGRFHTLAQYFQWMFGKGTSMTFLVDSPDYKTSRILVVPKYPSMLAYLNGHHWQAHELGNKNIAELVKPRFAHLMANQWAHFADARWRFGLTNPDEVNPAEFINAVSDPRKKHVERLLKSHLTMSCIESRPMGTALPCEDESYDNPAITPNALQLGIIRNLSKAISWLNKYRWDDLRVLRDQSVKHGLEAKYKKLHARQMAEDILDIANSGLRPNERWALRRAIDIVNSGKSAADRAIELYKRAKSQGKSDQDATLAVLENRRYPLFK